MSQVVERPLAADLSQPGREFAYRPISPLAMTTLIFGLLAATGLLAEVLLLVGLSGLLLGWLSLRGIRRAAGEVGGRRLALIGMLLSVIWLIGGLVLHVTLYVTEIPEGFQRVNFTRDISQKGFSGSVVHPDIRKLDGQKIFIKGYVYQTRQTKDLSEVVLVKDNQQCCFGQNPALKDMIRVKFKTPQEYKPGLVSIAGEFHTADPQESGNLKPLFSLDCERYRPAWKSY